MKIRYENESDLLSEENLDEFEKLRLITIRDLTPVIISEMP
jgi:hypothetical protein